MTDRGFEVRTRQHAVTVCVALLMVVTFCVGCPRPLPDRHLNEYVTKGDVVGTWRLTDEALTLLNNGAFKSEESHANTVSFREDGTCEFHSVMNDPTGSVYRELSGTWTLTHDTKSGANVRRKNSLDMTLQADDLTIYTGLSFDRVDGELVLWEFYGDPDMWEFVEYLKVEVDSKAR